MKKLYKEKEFRHFNKIRSLKAMKKRHKKKNCPKTSDAKKRNSRKKFVAPEIFSVSENPEKTIEYLTKVSEAIDNNRSVHLSLRKVTKISPEAILYMLVLVDAANEKKVSLSGTPPMKGTEAHRIFIYSGFYDFVNSGISPSRETHKDSILAVRTNDDVMPQEAKDIIDFMKKKSVPLKIAEEAAIYNTIIECMANTNDHAANGEYGKIHWWTMSIYDEINEKVHFAMVDNGAGIAKTINKRLLEKNVSDSEALKLAVSGNAPRSRTGKATRNQGLPNIKEYEQHGLISNLVLVANLGYYKVGADKKLNLCHHFKGSIISWDFEVRGKDENN